jgi:hypothetical protein
MSVTPMADEAQILIDRSARRHHGIVDRNAPRRRSLSRPRLEIRSDSVQVCVPQLRT